MHVSNPGTYQLLCWRRRAPLKTWGAEVPCKSRGELCTAGLLPVDEVVDGTKQPKSDCIVRWDETHFSLSRLCHSRL